MKQKKLFKTVIATAMALAMTVSLSNGMTVMAAEMNPNVDVVSQEETTKLNEITVPEISYQNPVRIIEFEEGDSNEINRKTGQIQFDESEVETMVVPMSDTTVVAGTVSDYLTATGEALLYQISLPANVYLQAQLTTPANSSLDYDLYLLDAEGYILTGSDYYTYINGTSGTLPEAFGYITSGDTATYYLYVYSSAGGSVTESFTLDYSVSAACDNWEIDERASEALAFTFGTDGAYIDSRNLSSPIDNDWYVITIPSSRIYNKLNISAITESANTCSVEVYQNVSSSGYQMKKIGNGNNVSVSTGTYYVRVSNAKAMDEYDDLDIQNYKLTITPVLSADSITITDLSGSEGKNKVVTYPGYGTYFRTQGSSTLTIYGVATATDPTTNKIYPVENTLINGLYYSPAWENNNTAANATRKGSDYTDAQGEFVITISLPPAIGTYMYDVGTSYHYFDICGVSASVADNSSVVDSEVIFHLAYTMYHSF